MQNPFISYIVPCYNVERFLRQCVESILAQSYTYFEIILIDDGAKDATPKLCDQLATEDNRILVIHQANQGLSGARNAGVKKAKGDYIIFLDSDDFWRDPNGLHKLVSQLGNDVDVLGFNCSYYYPESNTYTPWIAFDSSLSNPQPLQTAFSILLAQGITPMSACLKVLRRQWIVDKNLYFQTGILSEDIPWLIQMLELNPQVCFVNEYIYAYRQNTITSITRCNTSKSFNNLINILQQEYSKVPHRILTPSANAALMSFLAYEYCILLALVWNTENRLENLQKLRKFTPLFQYTQNPKVHISSIIYRLLGFGVCSYILNMYYRCKLLKK